MAIRGNTIGTPIKPEINLVKATDLTDKEKAQVLENIGAAPAGSGAGGSYVLTEEDKADIVSTVLGELPVYLGEVEIPGGEEQEHLYLLPEATYFDGSSTVIDTGVKLFDTPKDFTIFIDLTVTDEQYNAMKANQSAVFGVSKNESWRTSPLRVISTAGCFASVQSWGNSNLLSEESDNSWGHTWNTIDKLVLVFAGGVLQFGKYHKSTNNRVKEITANANNVYTACDDTLFIGAAPTDTEAGGCKNYFTGTVNDFRIYNRAMTEDEVLALMPSGYALNGEVE